MDFKCPLCDGLMDNENMTIKCPHCKKDNLNHMAGFQCRSCKKDIDIIKCSHCHEEYTAILALGGIKRYKTRTIELFNIPPVNDFEAGKFFRSLTGEEEFGFKWAEIPKSYMVYDLIYDYPGHSYAHGYLLKVSINTFEKLYTRVDYGEITRNSLLKKVVIGELSIELGGTLNKPTLTAKPIKLS